MDSSSKETAGALLTEIVSLEDFVEENHVNHFADNNPIVHSEPKYLAKDEFRKSLSQT